MAQIINTNSLSLLTQNNPNKPQSSLSSTIECLSSGLRISSTKDDVANQVITNRFTSSIRGLTQVSRNANDGISATQTAEDSLSKINSNLQRVRELTVQSSTGTNSQSDLDSIQAEITQRLNEINRVFGQTRFDGVKVLAKGSTLTIQVGVNDGETIDISLQGIDSKTLGLDSLNMQQRYKVPDVAADFGYQDKATAIVDRVDMATALTTIKTRDAATTVVTVKGEVQFDAENNKYYAELDVTGGATTTSGVCEVEVVTDGKVILADTDKDVLPKVIKDAKSYQGAVPIGLTNAKIVLIKGGADSTDAGTAGLVRVSFTGNNGKAIDGGYALKTDSSEYYVTSVDDSKTTSIKEVGYADKSGKAATATVQLGGVNGKVKAASVGGRDYLAGKVKDHNFKAEPKLNEIVIITTDNPLAKIDATLAKVASLRSNLDAVQNRFNSTIINLSNAVNSLSETCSRIEDADCATEVSSMPRANILQQAGTPVLAQADQTTQNVLSLLR